jgi:hypothetical protein
MGPRLPVKGRRNQEAERKSQEVGLPEPYADWT